ncbi:hypothetical protein BIV59_17445 [Bacillus sp. MUM 13]|nr:hypothetical protein BIV59_17445 [Bacillus sp. MUM 13]
MFFPSQSAIAKIFKDFYAAIFGLLFGVFFIFTSVIKKYMKQGSCSKQKIKAADRMICSRFDYF